MSAEMNTHLATHASYSQQLLCGTTGRNVQLPQLKFQMEAGLSAATATLYTVSYLAMRFAQ